MRIVLLGPPGAGKGTQADRLSEHFAVPAISTGEVFDMQIGRGTDLGKAAEEYVRRGELVPDDLVITMVKDSMVRVHCGDGFLFDGFPRNVPQAEAFAQMLADTFGCRVDVVVDLHVDEDEVLARIVRRAELEGRVDDTPETARRRLQVFEAETAPLRAYYADRGLLASVDGTGTVDEVTERIHKALSAHEVPGAD